MWNVMPTGWWMWYPTFPQKKKKKILWSLPLSTACGSQLPVGCAQTKNKREKEKKWNTHIQTKPFWDCF